MNKLILRIFLLIAVVAIASSGITYWLVRDDNSAMLAPAQAAPDNKKREVLYWYDPMMPGQHFDQPGQSPFMDMQLVPKYADETGSGEAAVSINPGVLENFAVRTTPVERETLTTSIDAAANVLFNERDVAIVQARSGGFVERTYDLAPGDVIEKGAPIVDLLLPTWGGAQEEFLAVLETGDAALIDAARTRLMLLGMPASLIERVENTHRPQPIITIDAPVPGMIKSLEVRTGMTLKKGDTLATLNGLKSVWLEAAVPGIQAEHVHAGQPVTASLTAYPGETFEGEVIAVLPTNDPVSRTLQVRIELPNPDLRLKPGMFARVQLETTTQEVLTVPSEAVIRGGRHDYALVANGEGGFTPVAVTLGAQSGQETVILSGLREGQSVVASGQFLIDSEASLAGALDRLESAESLIQGATAADTASLGAADDTISGRGKIEMISEHKITLSHGPIAALDWPAMTMAFELADSASADGFEVGDTIDFTLNQSETGYSIASVQSAEVPND